MYQRCPREQIHFAETEIGCPKNLKGQRFLHIAELRYVVDRGRMDYNHDRSHSSLADLAPVEFAGRRIASGQPAADLKQYGSDISSSEFARNGPEMGDGSVDVILSLRVGA